MVHPAPAAAVSVESIRDQFPALRRRHRGHEVAYFDAPGGTQVPLAVVGAMSRYLLEHNANTHWAYPTSEETDAILGAARDAVADLLGATPAEVVFGANMTTLTLHLARTFGRTWKSGDEVVVTELDHHANVDPWRALERDFGVVVRTAAMLPETGQIDLESLAALVTERTRLIAVGGASNALGTVNDLERVATMARGAGALLFVDAVHLAPHEPIDVARIGCDALAGSAYKMYGPHAGFLFVRRPLLEELPFPKVAPAPDGAPERAETGTQNHEAIAGMRAMVDFLAGLGGEGGSRRERLARAYELLAANGRRQAAALWHGLAAIPRVRLHGPAPPAPRTPTVAFTIEGLAAIEAARALAAEGLFLSHGDFYAATVLARLGVPALLRAGCAAYTTDDEVARLVGAVDRLARGGA